MKRGRVERLLLWLGRDGVVETILAASVVVLTALAFVRARWLGA